MPTELPINLPSGGTAVFVFQATAGEILIVIALLVLATIQLFNIIRQVAHVASKR